MRSFVAIEPPAEVRDEIELRAGELRRGLPPARWVAAANYHLTLVFLGSISSSQEAALAARLAVVFQRSTAFDLELDGGGCFPPGRPARVVWVGLTPAPPLLALQRAVARACREVVSAPADKRPFRPHLTVARCRRPWPRGAARRWREGLGGRLRSSFTVRRGSLMVSRLDPAGAVYELRARLPLAGES